MAERKIKAAFVEPMLLLKTEQLPEGESWLFELKFDGQAPVAVKF
jgi:ATP-dependent DNA ligase